MHRRIALALAAVGWVLAIAWTARALFVARRTTSIYFAKPKKPVTLRLDADIADHFRTSGRRWQTRIPARPGDPNSRL